LKGLLLLSGGLDSSLAGRLLLEQGIELVGLHLESPFGCENTAETMAAELGVPLLRRPKGDAFIDVLKNPEFGYGSVVNPCIDCRILMFTIAKKVMDETGTSFLVTGEVVGQRPMSQKRDTLYVIDQEAGMEGEILRPLSARLLPETRMEKEGIVDRKKLFGWAGRSRKPQLALAKKFGFKTIPSPAGGCLLTDDHFRERVTDFITLDDGRSRENASLLRHGRHYRFEDSTWVILGRNEKDNKALDEKISGLGVSFHPEGFNGPSVFFPAPLPPHMDEIVYGALWPHFPEHERGYTPIPAKTVWGESNHILSLEPPLEESPFLREDHWTTHLRH
jgi:tRNA U34 2-thiouridine synthase MnmA/TrmU